MKLIFYTLYRWARKYNFWDTPHLSAMYFLALFIFFNLLSLFVIVKLMLGYSAALPKIGVIGVVLILTAVILLVYFLFVKGRRYLKIEQEFEEGRISGKPGANIITIGYIILTIILFFGLAFIRN